ncbi:asparaginase [Celeribacter persicus]|uniref:Asparaginase n=1 Tax=Celeribacter persicus TaxID=1651082 RepID=A0A2T5HTR3_9RHOB|nr:asparaginase [Celeribacter persicus]PTQ74967.1 asparaginase [Celeribacter persicus]
MVEMHPMVEVWRGPILESRHAGFAVICNARGEVIEGWGDIDTVILPRSSVKMIQALPLVTSGAADAKGLTEHQLALSCASHQGAVIHTDRVAAWLKDLGLTQDDLICGPQEPWDIPTRNAQIKADAGKCRIHNNCSGKHCGFLTLTQHLGAGPDYVDPDHPVQKAVLDAFETVTGETSPGFGIDGCSAPNFATSVRGLGRAMGYFAGAREDGNTMERAAFRLAKAMRTHPDLVAGEGRACTELMRAARGKATIKTGAEGVFTAILSEQGLGVALKIGDGATRASECAIAAILVKLGALDANDPLVKKRLNPDVPNFAGINTGEIKPATGFPD